jgi:hypothetical protein
MTHQQGEAVTSSEKIHLLTPVVDVFVLGAFHRLLGLSTSHRTADRQMKLTQTSFSLCLHHSALKKFTQIADDFPNI